MFACNLYSVYVVFIFTIVLLGLLQSLCHELDRKIKFWIKQNDPLPFWKKMKAKEAFYITCLYFYAIRCSEIFLCTKKKVIVSNIFIDERIHTYLYIAKHFIRIHLPYITMSGTNLPRKLKLYSNLIIGK